MTGAPSQDLSRFDLPGFNLPLNFMPGMAKLESNGQKSVDTTQPTSGGMHLFANALYAGSTTGLASRELSLPLITTRELTMLQLMNQITDKLNWHIKVFDEGIASKWKDEALSAKDLDISERMINYCIAELRHKAKVYEETGLVTVYYGDVVKSDTAIPTWLQDELKAAVSPLENVPSRRRDWHPRSDDKVLDLVHPSLFPLIYGQSRILPNSLTSLQDCISRSCEGVVLAIPPIEDGLLGTVSTKYHNRGHIIQSPFSRKFQWLPCEVDISGSEDGVRITSYINNLHPHKHQDLYNTLEKVIARCIPLWNATLTPLRTFHYKPLRINYSDVIYDPDPRFSDEDDEGPHQEEDEDEDHFLDRRRDWIEEIREVIQPEPAQEFVPPAEPVQRVDLRKDYGTRGLQIIVKLANIHLTPEKPSYEGGTWHVEGQLNEHICASALYYYDSVNITDSSLAFRQQSNVEDAHHVNYMQNEDDWLSEIFDCQSESPAVQGVGHVETVEGRLLTWPNILQHRVQPFELADPTQPGHRKILALFLVDPNIRIISTANVPCQQKEWWLEEVQRMGGLAALPAELQAQVFDGVEDFPIALKEAKELRLELMEERTEFVEANEQNFENNYFSLCEH